MNGSPTPLRRDLVVFFGVLLAGALLVAAPTLVLLLPRMASPGEVAGLIISLVVLDLLVVAIFGSVYIQGRFVRPVERMVGDIRRMTEEGHHHRIGPVNAVELQAIRTEVNEMADNLLEKQNVLAENVASLDRTNAELVAARDELVRTARLASVGTLAAGIAHEVGNPLAALMAFTDLAKQRAGREGHDTELLGSIRAEADRIDRIVRTLLEYARGRGSPSGVIAVDAVVERVRDLVDAQGSLEGVEVAWPGPAPELPQVPGEAQQLEQILVNLLLNARDAMEGVEARAITVTLGWEEGALARMPARREDDPPETNYLHRRRVSHDVDPGGPDPVFTAESLVAIRVQDTGPGIPQEDLERVFDPFFTTKEPGKGTGLGLAICARLAEGMGGRMTVENAPEGGALFTIRLPAARHEHDDEVTA
ncbi:MAG TPA: ATP-binding protein [Longimicrobiales bacterium]|nr:ATP-binding protein [Longimicrobiales bacterium]